MTQIRIDVRELGAAAEDALAHAAAGDEVLIERDGAVGGELRSRQPAPVGDGKDVWRSFFEARRNDPPLDEEFERDLEEARRMLNQPVEIRSWE